MGENRWRRRMVIVIVGVFLAGCGRYGSAAPSPGATPSPKAYATPPSRMSAAMAYDMQAQELVMFGGFTEFGPTGALHDTWAWDGKGWTPRHPRTVPPIGNSSMTYDQKNHQLLMAGSDTSNQQERNFLWAWKDGDWTQLTEWDTPSCGKSCPPNLAVPFASGLVIYDSARSRVLMLAGGPGGNGGSLTWTWDGTKWIRIPTAHPPPLLSCCIHDSGTGHIVSLGYTGGGWGGINRLWIFDGSDWKLSSTSVPTGEAAIIDDPSTGTGLMLRSADDTGGSPKETWAWNASSWQRLAVTSPPVLTLYGLGSDAADKQVILFGGRDAYGNIVSDTWVWNGRAWNKQP